MRKILCAFLCAVMCALCISCGTAKQLDGASAAASLMSAGIFDENLSEVKPSVAEKRVAVSAEDVAECTAYSGTRAVVDEIVIIKAVSSQAAENVEKSFLNHIDAQKKVYADYNADEMPKLEDAFTAVYGDYAVMVVSKDSAKAQEIIKQNLK